MREPLAVADCLIYLVPVCFWNAIQWTRSCAYSTGDVKKMQSFVVISQGNNIVGRTRVKVIKGMKRMNSFSSVCCCHLLRWRNTRYKNPQLVAQHCFVASFGRCFAFFTLHESLHDQLDPQQKHLLQVEEMQRSDWLICQSASKFVGRQVVHVSLMKKEQQSQNLSHKVDPRSTFRNNFLQPATNVFVGRQVDYARWKTGNIEQNLQRNNVARQVKNVGGFCISYFAAFTRPYRETAIYMSCKTSPSALCKNVSGSCIILQT